MKLLAIDGNSLVNRAFYGIRPLENKEGFPTNAIFGFLTTLQRIIEETEPDGLCVTFDRKEKTFRHLAYDGYKAQRSAMPEELALQIPKLKEVLDAMNIPRFELAGWEADDLLGTMSRKCEEAGHSIIIATGDKDSLQLITDKTYIYLVTTRMGKTTTTEMDPLKFEESYGFTPTALVDLKALMGDASDNIPGVRGIGEKTGKTLIQTYGTIKEIYENIETIDVKPAVRKKLIEGEESAQMSFDLATIRCDAPIDFVPDDMGIKPVNQGAVSQIFTWLGFHRMLSQMGFDEVNGGESAPKEKAISLAFAEITTEEQVENLLAKLRSEAEVAVLPLDDFSAIALHCDGETSLLLHQTCPRYEEVLREIFSPMTKKIAHGSKELMLRLLKEGYSTEGFILDTEIAAYLLAPTDGSYQLDQLGALYFAGEGVNEEGKQLVAKDYLREGAFSPLESQKEAKEALSYHVSLIANLGKKLLSKLEQNGLLTLFYEVEMPLCPVLAEMELDGILVDRKALEDFGAGLKTRIAQIQKEIYEEAEEEFNVNSTQQLGVILFEKLGLPPVKKTKTGYSTSVEVLEKLLGMHPIIELVMEYRQLAKLNSTYVEGLGKVIAPDGRIHTCFQNTVTATGRLSSTEPNLQNIPVRTALGAQMREMFVAAEGKVLVDADYSQIELRILAHIAEDEAMRGAFRIDADIHAITAAQVFGVPQEDVTSDMRRHAKAVNFGIVYGISEFSLSQDIGVTRREAGEYMQRYFATYPNVRKYMDEIIIKAKEDGFVQTELGRKRWLPELRSSNFNMRSFGERVALNMPIQGTAADVMKLAMIKVRDRLKKEKLEARLVLQVHDELIVECPLSEAELVKTYLQEEMEGAAKLSVPLEATAAFGKTWAEAK